MSEIMSVYYNNRGFTVFVYKQIGMYILLLSSTEGSCRFPGTSNDVEG